MKDELTVEVKEYTKLLKLAKAKLDYFTKLELENFIKNYSAEVTGSNVIQGTTISLEPTYENLRTSLDYITYSYNNSMLGLKSEGGEKYKRCVTTISNSELAPREMEIRVKWYCPSGIGDGSMSGVYKLESYVLTDQDILEIKVRGSAREYLKNILGIKDDLYRRDEKPYELPSQTKNKNKKDLKCQKK